MFRTVGTSSATASRSYGDATSRGVTRRSVPTVAASGPLFPRPPSVQGKLGDKYAVVEVGGGQQIVEEGRRYSCHRLNVEPGSVVKFPRVVVMKEKEALLIGDPYLENCSVEAEILEEYRAKKILVLKYKPKKHYRKVRGHRQEMTRFLVTKISKD